MRDSAISAAASHPIARTIDVSVGGKWVAAPAVDLNGQTIVVRGKRIRIASVHDADWIADAVADPAACIQVLKKGGAGIRADIFYFSQQVRDCTPHFDYPMEMRSIAVADVSSFQAWWRKIAHGTRNNINQAKKRGVVVRVQEFNDDLIRGIMSVQNENPIRQGRRFYHYGKTFEQTKRDHGSFLGSCDFICAYRDDEFLGFLKLIYHGDVASIMQISSKLAFQHFRPANALIQKAAEICVSKGIPNLVYGEFNYWNKRESTLRNFKTNNGFEEMLVPEYYVPLTPWGSICVKAKLYRGLIGILPAGAIAAALNLRLKWHKLFAKRPAAIRAPRPNQ